MFYNFANATDFRRSGHRVGIDNAESEIGVEKRMHHDTVAKLEDLERKYSSGEENQRKRKQR